MSDIFDKIAASEDVQEELVHIDQWDVDILFRGMSLAALEALQSETDLEAASKGNLDEAIRLVAATACDPVTRERIFDTPEKVESLRLRNGEAVLKCVNEGALVVLGVDGTEPTAGKDSSSDGTGTPPSDESSSESPEN
jgi:hypothetical protein